MNSRQTPPAGNGQGPAPGAWTFFRQWLRHPLSIAAVSPSSRQLARRMIAELPDGASRVIELGGGTGVFTQVLLEHGIAAEDLLVLELNEELHHHLHRRFPEVHLACGDARDLVAIGQRTGFLDAGPADAVISGLGLLSMARPLQRDIVGAAFDAMRPDGRFIQFTYGPACPVAREVMKDLGLSARRGNFAWLNMPPATVYVLTRDRSTPVTAKKAR